MIFITKKGQNFNMGFVLSYLYKIIAIYISCKPSAVSRRICSVHIEGHSD